MTVATVSTTAFWAVPATATAGALPLLAALLPVASMLLIGHRLMADTTQVATAKFFLISRLYVLSDARMMADSSTVARVLRESTSMLDMVMQSNLTVVRWATHGVEVLFRREPATSVEESKKLADRRVLLLHAVEDHTPGLHFTAYHRFVAEWAFTAHPKGASSTPPGTRLPDDDGAAQLVRACFQLDLTSIARLDGHAYAGRDPEHARTLLPVVILVNRHASLSSLDARTSIFAL